MSTPAIRATGLRKSFRGTDGSTVVATVLVELMQRIGSHRRADKGSDTACHCFSGNLVPILAT